MPRCSVASVNYPPAVPFPVETGHPNESAHRWLSALLDSLDWTGPAPCWPEEHVSGSILRRLNEQTTTAQIALLKACLERMPWHRQQRRASQETLSTDQT
jgi:hypothetical protein